MVNATLQFFDSLGITKNIFFAIKIINCFYQEQLILTIYSMKVYDSQGGTLLVTASNTLSTFPSSFQQRLIFFVGTSS